MTKRKRERGGEVDGGDEDLPQRKKRNSYFLASITSQRSRYVKDFKNTKMDLAERLFAFYNKTIFGNKLPKIKITWNKRLTSTGGQCFYCISDDERYSRIELSDKVCDSADRVRDILAHEMCHAATWIIDGSKTDGHGDLWQAHADRVTQIHPELPKVTICHDYAINYTFTYRCDACNKTVGRFREIPPDKAICRMCQSRLCLVSPR
ncbi:germ cell nuclear acidic protein-like [Hyla sarda]|uniref:germ cell nuclear acidic protein-like n=1 Tax=Hyla sarda TaxID=327740 RepID=UPI0024C301C3|nr:germ cell nuclear acidic protein-like [Hyla sarda]